MRMDDRVEVAPVKATFPLALVNRFIEAQDVSHLSKTTMIYFYNVARIEAGAERFIFFRDGRSINWALRTWKRRNQNASQTRREKGGRKAAEAVNTEIIR
jgi:hypothetical protein